MSKTELDPNLAQLAKRLAVNCVRNTQLEGFHARRGPRSRSGDFTDVTITDGYGETITWNEASFINQGEMKILMKQVVNRLYTSLVYAGDPRFVSYLARYDHSISLWDDPEIDDNMIEQIGYLEKTRAMDEESD